MNAGAEMATCARGQGFSLLKIEIVRGEKRKLLLSGL
jgi:hypothetical protein